MNFQRGLKRVFTVIAAGWALVWLAFAIAYVPENHQNPGRQVMEYAVTIVVPIALTYFLLFIVIPWVGRGFKL